MLAAKKAPIKSLKNQIVEMDCLDGMRLCNSESFDAMVTDPPYGLSKEPDIAEVLQKWLRGEEYQHISRGFMGKDWDSFVPSPTYWKEAFRLLKPGAYALVFAGTRTQDLMTISLRLAGFEIRDVIEWLYFSGWPKSMDVSKAFDKEAGLERAVIGMRKSDGGNNFDAYRSGEGRKDKPNIHKTSIIPITEPASLLAKEWEGWGTALKPAHEPIIVARKPLVGTVTKNIRQYGTGAINIDGCRIPKPEGDRTEYGTNGIPRKTGHIYGKHSGTHEYDGTQPRFPANIVTLEEDAFWSKYANVTPKEVSHKATKKDRGEGNSHISVKPTDLMAWLCRLITRPGGNILDPYAGSGSTLVAAYREGFSFLGFEREADSVQITKSRLRAEGWLEEAV